MDDLERRNGERSSPESKDERKACKRHRGVGREGLRPGEANEPAGDEQGLGHEGVEPDRPRDGTG
jgi:hypothetical protein